MINDIYVNIPIQDVNKSREFFTKLGFKINENFSGPNNLCVIINPTINVMLTLKENFTQMTNKPIADKTTSEAIISIGCDSKETVTRICETAIKNGARKVNEPEDQGFMFSWAFEDLDGHLWDLFWMEKK